MVDRVRECVALIGRLDRNGTLLWSLPKGHIEDGETTEQTAVREVKEETGISAQVLTPLGTIDYWFVAERRRVHKTVHHFLLEATGGELSDADDEVTEVAWVPFAQLEHTLAYADERKLARKAREMLGTLSPRRARSELPELRVETPSAETPSAETARTGAVRPQTGSIPAPRLPDGISE